MKRMYKQPETEVTAFQTDRLMDGLVVSNNGAYEGEPIGD